LHAALEHNVCGLLTSCGDRIRFVVHVASDGADWPHDQLACLTRLPDDGIGNSEPEVILGSVEGFQRQHGERMSLNVKSSVALPPIPRGRQHGHNQNATDRDGREARSHARSTRRVDACSPRTRRRAWSLPDRVILTQHTLVM